VDAVGFVTAKGGIVSRADLLSAGVSGRALTDLVAGGSLRRPRNGWYSTLSPRHPRFRAVRIGGALTGASALAEMGAWMLHPPPRLDVAVAGGAARLRSDPGAIVHWNARGSSVAGVAGLTEALVRVVLDDDLEVSVPCIDWAFRTGRLDHFSFEQLVLELPRSADAIRFWVDPESQSLLESVARVRLVRRGWAVRSQVRVGDIEAIDLVIADQVALELDGRKFHEKRFDEDRRKDLLITIEGRHSLRVSYAMLVHDWPNIERAIESALRARGLLAQNSGDSPPEPRASLRVVRSSSAIS